MIPLNNLEKYEKEITDILNANKGQRMSRLESDKFQGMVTEKLNNLITNHPIGSLSKNFLNAVSQHRSVLPRNWDLYRKLDEYTRIEGNEGKKQKTLKYLAAEIEKLNSRVLQRHEVLSLAKSIYLGKSTDLIHLFYKSVSIPPLSLFDKDHQPDILVKRELKKAKWISEFKEQNKQDKDLEKKIMFMQRRIRAKVRYDSEVKRLSERHFKNYPDGMIYAEAMIKKANTPYYPQKCSPEFAERIMAAASSIKLYESVYHMLDASRTHLILDSALYGRANLLNSYTNFRPAALVESDVENGDGNVICMGPDKIDPRCLVGRTVRLELDLKVLLDESKFQKNPTIFFKQNDLGYSTGPQSIEFGKNNVLRFEPNGVFDLPDEINSDFLLLDSNGKTEYYSQIKKDLFISYNVEEMDKILILNFFRFLDSLQSANGNPKLAADKIKSIYNSIGALSDEELTHFLKELGQKMSSSAEFNFSGAYKIDLNALKSLTFYDKQSVVNQVKIEDLCDQLNSGKFDLLNTLKDCNPEIFKSSNFVEFLSSKVNSQEAKEAIANHSEK